MFKSIEIVGFDEILKCNRYQETRICDNCHKEHSFTYTASYSLDVLIKSNSRPNAYSGYQHGDICYWCKELKDHKQVQLALF